jgi:hypothetical protein
MRFVGVCLLLVGLRHGGMLRVMRRPHLRGRALHGLRLRAGEGHTEHAEQR